MFWVKTDAIRPLLELDWKYDMFPDEEGQIDGGTQHGIERLFGELILARGYKQALYFSIVGFFSSDPGAVPRKL
jgi:lipopolysaccharide biosynthesis protein